MIRLPAGLSPDDVRQWLGDGVFLCKLRSESGHLEWAPCQWLSGVNGSNRVHAMRLSDNREVTVACTSCAAFWPHMGAINVEAHGVGWAVWTERFVERQYRRTLHAQGVQMRAPFSYVASTTLGLNPRQLVEFSTVVRALVNPKWPASFGEACERIDRGWPSVAVNRRLIVAGARGVDKRMLYLDGRLVTTIQGGLLHHIGTELEAAYVVKELGGYLAAASP